MAEPGGTRSEDEGSTLTSEGEPAESLSGAKMALAEASMTVSIVNLAEATAC